MRRDAELYETFRFELLADVTLGQIQEETADRIHELFNVAVTGRLLNRSLVKAVRASVQEAARARRITKNKQLEIDLLLYILRQCIDNYSGPVRQRVRRLLQRHGPPGGPRCPPWSSRACTKTCGWNTKSELDDVLRELHGRKKSHNLKFELPREFAIPD